MNRQKKNSRKPFPPFLPGASMLGREETRELRDVIREKSPFRHYGLGSPHKVLDLEEFAREYTGSACSLAVSSGSAALYCAVAALGIGPGDEVILPAFTWFSDYNAVVHSGALPVFADIDDSLGLSPEDFERKITDHTKAVMIVHYQGGPAKIDKLMSIAQKNDIRVIEDCAQSFGGTFDGKKLGTFGDIGITSFQINKMITCGEGGLLYTDNEEYFERAVRYHDLGGFRDAFLPQIKDKSLADQSRSFVGLQFRMSELQGAVMLAQIRKLDGILSSCRDSSRMIRDHFKDNGRFGFRHTDEGDCGITTFLRFGDPEESCRFREILSGYDMPVSASSSCSNLLHQYPVKTRNTAFKDLPPFGKGYAGYDIVYDENTDCPDTDRILASHVAIPIGPLYTKEHIRYIIRAIEETIRKIYG